MTVELSPTAASASARDPNAEPQPIFVLSITRSGSTLVQRVLGAHDGVATVSEPWILIPLLYTMRERGVVSEYTHPLAVQAIEDFVAQLPDGVDSYREGMRRFVLDLYRQASPPGSRFFVDKTPPYFLVAEDILELFPDARVILLWRNPVSIVASLIEYSGEVWEPAAYRENLFDGIAKLVRAQSRFGDRVCAVRYEDLVTGDEGEWRRIVEHVGLEFDRAALSMFSEVALEGRFGDPFGVHNYRSLSTEPLAKWRTRISNPIRRDWCRRHLRWLGHDRLALMGYDLNELLDELDAAPMSRQHLATDTAAMARALIKEPLRARARRSLSLGGPSVFRYLLAPRRGRR